MNAATSMSDRTANLPVEFDAKGRMQVAPMSGFGLLVVAESLCVLRVEFARTREQQLIGPPDAVQLVLTPAQASTLAEALGTAAARTLSTPSEVTRN
jgi:hypothetical protein